MAEMMQGWEELLGDEASEQVAWMRSHKALVYVVKAPEDPLHHLPPELVLEVLLDRHGVFKLRGPEEELDVMVGHAYVVLQSLFDFIRDR